ncbi:hypothetical protein R6Q59_015231 [Mikania micrantha]
MFRHIAYDYGLCGKGLLKEAKHLFLKMDERGCPPDDVLTVFFSKDLRTNSVRCRDAFTGNGWKSYSLDASTLSLLIDQSQLVLLIEVDNAN